MAAATSSYASSTSLVATPKEIARVDAARRKEGWYIPAPTVDELRRRRNYLRFWYQPRDFMFEMFISMARLESPFASSKASVANKSMHITGSGQEKYTISTAPFDALTLAMAMPADRHPYVTTYPTHKAHTDQRMSEFDRFAQAAIDTASNQSDFMMDMFNKLAVTGWLPTLAVFDPARQKQGVFPFDLQVLDPMNVYPQLDGQRRPMYAFVEHRLNGAQLLQNYSMFAGVAEIAEAEKPPVQGSAEYDRYDTEGNNFLTTEFDVSEYYDDTYRAILLGCSDATDTACEYNPMLARLKAKSKQGKLASVMHGSGHEDNPYCGIEQHHLGCMPLSLEGCWPEPVGPINRKRFGAYTSNYFTGYFSYTNNTWGRLVYYPFLYSMRNNWIDQSKLRDMIYRSIEELSDAKLKVSSDNQKKFQNIEDQKVVFVDPDNKEDVGFITPPSVGAETMALMNYVDQEIRNGAWSGSAYGMRGGSSARQQEASLASGTVRENVLTRAVERAVARYPKAITHTLMERGGDEQIFVSGNGTKYGKQGDYLDYSASGLGGVVPEITVELKQKNGLRDPNNVMAYNSLKGTKDFSTEFLMRTVLDIVNPEKIIADSKKEMIEADVSVLQPQVEVAALEAQQKELPNKWKAQEQLQLAQDQYQHELDMKQVALDMSQLPDEKHAAVERASIQQILLQASQPPDQGQGQQGPFSSPGNAGSPQTPNQQAGGQGPFGMSPSPTLPNPGGTFSSPSPMQNPFGQMSPPMSQPMGPGAGAPRPPMPLSNGLPPGPRPPMPMPPPGMMQHRPMPMPMPMPGPNPVGRPNLSGLPADFAKGPGQRDRLQPLSAYQPSGGFGRPGVPPGMMSGAGLHGTPMDTPAIEAANVAFRPPTLTGRKRKRGARGR